jgi:hypothetical protein
MAKILYLKQDFKHISEVNFFLLTLNVFYNTALKESTATPIESVPAKKKQHINLRQLELPFLLVPSI